VRFATIQKAISTMIAVDVRMAMTMAQLLRLSVLTNMCPLRAPPKTVPTESRVSWAAILEVLLVLPEIPWNMELV
jgi:hypothetical protein